MTFEVYNWSGRESFTNLQWGEGTAAEYYTQLLNGEVPDHVLCQYGLGNRSRNEAWWGGNYEQYYI